VVFLQVWFAQINSVQITVNLFFTTLIKISIKNAGKIRKVNGVKRNSMYQIYSIRIIRIGNACNEIIAMHTCRSPYKFQRAPLK
jgi:hypothetical protein